MERSVRGSSPRGRLSHCGGGVGKACRRQGQLDFRYGPALVDLFPIEADRLAQGGAIGRPQVFVPPLSVGCAGEAYRVPFHSCSNATDDRMLRGPDRLAGTGNGSLPSVRRTERTSRTTLTRRWAWRRRRALAMINKDALAELTTTTLAPGKSEHSPSSVASSSPNGAGRAKNQGFPMRILGGTSPGQAVGTPNDCKELCANPFGP